MDDIEAASEAAKLGAAVLLKHWEQLGKADADMKARNDWVSRADRESEAAIVASDSTPALAKSAAMRCLDGSSAKLRVLRIIFDPGVFNRICAQSSIIAGVIFEPLRDLFFTASRGAGAFRNGVRMQVSDQKTIEGSFLATGFPFRAQQYVSIYVDIFKDVISLAKGVRRAGSAAIDLAYSAAGIFDGFFELHLSPWDVAAGSLMITEAGGVVSDFSGGDRWFERGNIVGATPAVHRELVALIGRHVREDQLR